MKLDTAAGSLDLIPRKKIGYVRDLRSYSLGKVAGVVFCLNYSMLCLALKVIQVIYLDYCKVNIIPCMFTAALSLGQQVDDWLHRL